MLFCQALISIYQKVIRKNCAHRTGRTPVSAQDDQKKNLCHFNKMRVFLVVIHAMVACACSDYMRSVVEYYQPCSACDYFMWLCDNGTRTWDTVESVRSTFKYIQDG